MEKSLSFDDPKKNSNLTSSGMQTYLVWERAQGSENTGKESTTNKIPRTEHMKNEVLYSLKKTSLKGIPRIFSSESVFQKIIWSLAVLFFLVLCGVQVSYNLIEFLQYDSVVTVTEERLDLVGTHSLLPPDILVCNKNPFTGNLSAYQAAGAPLPREYIKQVNKRLDCNGFKCSPELKAMAETAKGFIFSSRGYYQSVGKEKASAVSHQHMVVVCKVMVYVYATIITIPCQHLTKVTKVVHPEFFNCFHYQLIEKDMPVIGYVLILHIDNLDSNPHNLLDSYTLPSKSAGAWINLIPPGNPPILGFRSFSIPPGFDTILQYKISTSSRLSRPYRNSDCEETEDTAHISNTTYNYTLEMCMAECTREGMAETCQCNEVNSLTYPELFDSPYDYCISLLPKNMFEFFHVMLCMAQKVAGIAYKCFLKCKVPCKVVEYKTQISAGKWPAPSQLCDFYENFIENSVLEQKYRKYGHHLKKMCNKTAEAVLEPEQWVAARVFEDNFAQVTISLMDDHVMKYEERPKVTMAMFVSQLGGTLNLWAGITVVVFIEMIDFLYRVLMCGRLAERARDKASDGGGVKA